MGKTLIPSSWEYLLLPPEKNGFPSGWEIASPLPLNYFFRKIRTRIQTDLSFFIRLSTGLILTARFSFYLNRRSRFPRVVENPIKMGVM